MSANATSQQQALEILKQNGIGADFLTKVQGYLNNPIAGMVAKMAGVNLDNVKTAISSLQGQPSNLPTGLPTPPQQQAMQVGNGNDRLATFRQGLQQLHR